MQTAPKPNILIRRFSNPWMPTLLYSPIALILIVLSVKYQPKDFLSVIIFVSIGLFSWTLVEYFLHRFVFHWTQVKDPWKTLASGLHMAHHKSANAEDLILSPPFVSFAFGIILYLLFSLITQSFANGALLESGLLGGYVFYEWVHYGSHRYHPKSVLGKYLQQYHLKHHFKNPNGTFGVTSPLWDTLFGTR